MNADFAAAMRRATLLTRAQEVAGATRLIQIALAGQPASESHGTGPQAVIPPRSPQPSPGRLVDADIAGDMPGRRKPASSQSAQVDPSVCSRFTERTRRPRRLGEVLEALRDGKAKLAVYGRAATLKARRQPPPVPEGAQFLMRSYACAAGGRRYKLYIPASARDRPRGLIVMLHGCKQDPDDFATGTNMNAVAERHGMLVAYPHQPSVENAMSCWHWFRPTDQRRDAGEPAIIAGLTEEIMREFGLERRRRVFVAGLSAGGAMAAVMGETYPDLYAAIGIHSGLPYGSATDVVSAFTAMRGDAGSPQPKRRRTQAGSAPRVRMIVFHGSEDPIVHPSNAERIVAPVLPNATADRIWQQTSSQDGGRNYTRTVVTEAGGDPLMEYWLVDGAVHAWAGGDSSGSYTDPTGPDASSEMMRFFLALPATEKR